MTKSEKATCLLIAGVVCNFYNLSFVEMITKSRKIPILWPRQVTHSLINAHFKSNIALSEIGCLVGMCDHATILNSFKTVRNLTETDKSLRAEVDQIMTMIALALYSDEHKRRAMIKQLRAIVIHTENQQLNSEMAILQGVIERLDVLTLVDNY